MSNVVLGTGEDGADVLSSDYTAKFLLHLRARQEATWAVVVHGRVVVPLWQGHPSSCTVYIPEKYRQWWEQHEGACTHSLRAAAEDAWEVTWEWLEHGLTVQWLLEVPPDLHHFVTENTGRPMPRRYNTTAVQLYDRDGVAWLTHPEAKLYDALKQTNWLFIPQPPFLAGEEFDRRVDLLIFWENRAAWAVIVEVDSDTFHPPSQRTHDEAREREFQSRGFHFLRFSVKEVNENPTKVLGEIASFCRKRFGG